MNESDLTVKLEKTLDSVERIEGVDGTLVVDNQGEILYSSILSNDVSLFGSMANIISNSSEKLLDLSNQGSGERILVESARGKALFLSLEKAHLVVLTHIKANIGMIMISSKRAVEEIKEMDEIKELPDYIEEILEEETLIEETEVNTTPETEISELKESITETATSDIPDTETTEISEGIIESAQVSDLEEEKEEKVEPLSTDSQANELEITSTTDSAEVETTASETEISLTEIEDKVKPETEGEIESELEIEAEEVESDILPDESEIEKLEADTVEESIVEPLETINEELEAEKVKEEIKVEEKVKEKVEEPSIPELPVIKPPLSFPPLPENVEVPDNLEDKSNLIINIYESILLAMSIGASKIMGVAPARGMLKKSLPYDDCKELLDGVDVKSNSALNFKTIRENLEKIPIETRSEESINDFTALISAITDNYGRVMGYDAFRGMIRPEFKKIYDSYGLAMESLGIKEKIHPELRELLVS